MARMSARTVRSIAIVGIFGSIVPGCRAISKHLGLDGPSNFYWLEERPPAQNLQERVSNAMITDSLIVVGTIVREIGTGKTTIEDIALPEEIQEELDWAIEQSGMGIEDEFGANVTPNPTQIIDKIIELDEPGSLEAMTVFSSDIGMPYREFEVEVERVLHDGVGIGNSKMLTLREFQGDDMRSRYSIGDRYLFLAYKDIGEHFGTVGLDSDYNLTTTPISNRLGDPAPFAQGLDPDGFIDAVLGAVAQAHRDATAIANRPPATPLPRVAGEPEGSVTPTAIPTLEFLPRTASYVQDDAPSPDGRWIVRHIAHDEVRMLQDADREYEQVWVYHSQHLISVDGSITHTIRSDWLSDGFGGSLPEFIAWAPDSSAAYVAMSGAPDGCGVGWSSDLRKISLPDGAITELDDVPGRPVLSPDGRRLGGVRSDGENGVVVSWIQTATGTWRSLNIDLPARSTAVDGEGTAEAMGLIWSPDSRSIVVHVAHDACGERWREALVFVELAVGSSSMIFESSDGHATLTVSAWADDGTLSIVERSSPMAGISAPPIEHRIDARTGAPR